MSKEPFMQENIINRFLRKAKVDSLKELRKVDEKWLYLDNKELERRSKWGQFKHVEFSKEHFQEDLQLFLDETEASPELFRSFRFEFRDAFKFLDASFFALYRPQFLQLKFSDEFKFTQEAAQYLGNLLGWISEEIQELQVFVTDRFYYKVEGILPAFFQIPLVFPNLIKFSYREGWEGFTCIEHFHCILNKSLEVDPAPNLTFLDVRLDAYGGNLEDFFGSDPTTPTALSRWSKLRHLTLGSYTDLQRVSPILRKMASAGMSLESFELFCGQLKPGLDFAPICLDLSQFFRPQAESLKILKLGFKMGEKYYKMIKPFVGIFWPIFKNVHTLQLKYGFFDMGPIPIHFPSLSNLEIGGGFDLEALYPVGIQSSSIPALNIFFGPSSQDRNTNNRWITWMVSKFNSVVHFKCNGEMVGIGQRELPWNDTLEVLGIGYVRGPIKVGHLNALKKLVIYNHLGYWERAWFEEALALNLSSITFKCFYIDTPSKELKDAFIQYFPYPVQFEEMELVIHTSI